MARASWTNISCIGTAIFNQFMSLVDIPPDDEYIDKEISKLTALSQSAQTLSTLKTANVTANEIAGIKKLLSYIPKEIMVTALAKVNEHK